LGAPSRAVRTRQTLCRCQSPRFASITSARQCRQPAPAESCGEERRFYYSASWQLVQEDIDENYTGSPGVDRYAQQFWGIRYIDDAAARRRVDGQSESLYFHITDGQFSTVAMLDESAALKERVSYSAYGRATHHWAGDWDGDGYVTAMDEDLIYIHGMEGAVVGDAEYDPDFDLNRDGIIDYDDALVGKYDYGRGPLGAGRISDPFGADNPIGYSGYVFNPETGLLLARHRYYHPQLGRWMSEDWLGYPDGMNRFEYVAGSPAVFADPMGLFRLTEWIVDRLSGSQGASTAESQRLRDTNCADLKRNFETGKICEAEFEKWWKALDCGEDIGAASLWAPRRDSWKGRMMARLSRSTTRSTQSAWDCSASCSPSTATGSSIQTRRSWKSAPGWARSRESPFRPHC
jgi:RHS repeat-associated protein